MCIRDDLMKFIIKSFDLQQSRTILRNYSRNILNYTECSLHKIPSPLQQTYLQPYNRYLKELKFADNSLYLLKIVICSSANSFCTMAVLRKASVIVFKLIFNSFVSLLLPLTVLIQFRTVRLEVSINPFLRLQTKGISPLSHDMQDIFLHPIDGTSTISSDPYCLIIIQEINQLYFANIFLSVINQKHNFNIFEDNNDSILALHACFYIILAYPTQILVINTVAMNQLITEEDQRILNLAALTYQSNDTLAIQHAIQQLRGFLIQNYPKSFSKIEDLITRKAQIDVNIRKALISVIKMTALQLKQLLEKQLLRNDQILNQNKQLLHIIQHAIDNNKIQPEIKQPLIFTYIHLFSLYNPDNYDRLISKTRYYFNTKEDTLALQILETYHESNAPYKCKYEFYTKILPMLVDYLHQKLSNLFANNPDSFSPKNLLHLSNLIALLAKFWTSLNFQRYESIFINLFKYQKLISIFQMFLGQSFPQNLQLYADQISQHIILSLKASKLHKDFQQLTHLLQSLYLKNKEQFMIFQTKNHLQHHPLKYPISKLKLLVAGIDTNNQNFNLASLQFSPFQLFSKLIFPNFKNIEFFLRQNADNVEQIFNFLEDATFDMKSQCQEILVHKMFIKLCKSSNSILIDFRTIIYSFLFGYLVQISNGQVPNQKVNYNYSAGLDFWAQVANLIPQKQLINCMLLTIGISSSLFVSDMQFMNDLNRFAGRNSKFLLQKNQQITFYSLLIYRNFRDDIFHNNFTSHFEVNMVDLALSKQHNNIITKFSLCILKEQFEGKPTYELVELKIKHILTQTPPSFDQYFDSLLTTILTNYHHKIKPESIISFAKNIIQNLKSSNQQTSFCLKLERYLPAIASVIKNPTLGQPIFKIIVVPLIDLIQILPNKNIISGRVMLQLAIFTLQYGCLSQNLISILMRFKWQFDDIQTINSFTKLIRKINDLFLINWLLKLLSQQLNIFTALLIQNIVYYQSDCLNFQNIELLIANIYIYFASNKKAHDYLSGKLANIYLLLLRFKKTVVHEILLNQKWIAFKQQTKQKYALLTLFQNNMQDQSLPFIDEYYRIVYQQENIYRWKYDMQVFIINQIALFRKDLANPYQFKYANVSLVACLSNAVRAFEYYEAENRQWEECQDQQFYLKNQIDQENERNLKLLESFDAPQQFKQDFFILLHDLIKWLKSTNQSTQWLQTIIKKVFPSEDFLTLREMLNMEICQNNKIRRIIKVKHQNNK